MLPIPTLPVDDGVNKRLPVELPNVRLLPPIVTVLALLSVPSVL